MASTTLINASAVNAESTPLEISGINSLIVTGATMKDRVEVHLDNATSGVLAAPPWAQTLNTGTVDLKVKVRNNSGNDITVKLETTA